MAENTNAQQNTETTKEETMSLLEELKGDEEKEGINTKSFLLGMAAGAAITGTAIFLYNRFFNGD